MNSLTSENFQERTRPLGSPVRVRFPTSVRSFFGLFWTLIGRSQLEILDIFVLHFRFRLNSYPYRFVMSRNSLEFTVTYVRNSVIKSLQ